VFATEPTTESPLFGLPNVVVTPHLGASTSEAQDRAGTDVARSVLLALRGDFVPDAVNVASGGAVGEEVRPYLALTQKLGLVLSALSANTPTSVAVEVRGELSNDDVSVLSLAALRGVFSGVVEDQVTFVNATQIAEARGVAVTLTKEAESPNHRSLVTLRGVYPNGDVLTVSGTVSGIAEIEKVVEVHGRSFDLRAEGVNLLLEYEDRPGVMGVVGTLLGKIGINIEAAQISQTSDGEDAVMILRVDRSVDPSVLESIGASVRATIIRTVDFS
jgi:D-3-phosphoglycerate dehydrogenase